MTPTDVTPPVGAEASDISSGFDAAFDAAMTSDSGGTATAPEPEPEPVAAEEPAPEPEGEEPVSEGGDEEQATTDEPEPEATTDPNEKELLVDRKGIRVNPERWKNEVYPNHQYAMAVRRFAPTVEAAKAHYEQATDFRDMRSDYMSGEPESVERFTKFWLNESPDTFPTMVQGQLGTLKQANPQAYAQMRDSMVDDAIEAMYEQAWKTGDKNLLYKTQTLEYARTGKYRTEPTKLDPLAERESALKRREDELKQRDARALDQTWKQIDSSKLTGAKAAALDEIVGEHLKPIKGKVDDIFYDDLARSIKNVVGEELSKDYEWTRNHNIDLADVKRAFAKAFTSNQRTDLNPMIRATVEDYSSRVRQIVAAAAKPRINALTAKAVADNKAKHDRLSASQRKGAGAGAGRPVASGRPEPKTMEEMLDQLFAS